MVRLAGHQDITSLVQIRIPLQCGLHIRFGIPPHSNRVLLALDLGRRLLALLDESLLPGWLHFSCMDPMDIDFIKWCLAKRWKIDNKKWDSLSKLASWNFKAMAKWSPFFHWLWSHSGTFKRPLAVFSHSLLNLALMAFLVLISLVCRYGVVIGCQSH